MYKFHVTIDTIHGLSSVKPSPEGEGASFPTLKKPDV